MYCKHVTHVGGVIVHPDCRCACGPDRVEKSSATVIDIQSCFQYYMHKWKMINALLLIYLRTEVLCEQYFHQ